MIPRSHRQHRHLALPSAFSLVEVVLALGMMSFAMVSVLGLIPVGLGNFRDARKLSVESGIAQRLAGDLRLAEAAGRSTAAGHFYFDDQGTPVAEDAALYIARIGAPVALSAGEIVSRETPARSILITIFRKGNPEDFTSFPVIVGGDR